MSTLSRGGGARARAFVQGEERPRQIARGRAAAPLRHRREWLRTNLHKRGSREAPFSRIQFSIVRYSRKRAVSVGLCKWANGPPRGGGCGQMRSVSQRAQVRARSGGDFVGDAILPRSRARAHLDAPRGFDLRKKKSRSIARHVLYLTRSGASRFLGGASRNQPRSARSRRFNRPN